VVCAGALATTAALWAVVWWGAAGLRAGFGAGVVAEVVAGAAAVLVVREDELDEDAPQPAAASATRHENRIAGGRG
jgi:hypothetical protein